MVANTSATMSQNTYTCPTDCEAQLPVLAFNECAPELRDNAVAYILLARPDQPFANIEDPAEHTDRTSNTSTASNAVRRLKVLGSYNIEFGEARPVGRDTYFAKNTGTVNALIYDNTDENYEFIRSLGCNTKFLVWLIGFDGYIRGGNDGIQVVLQGRENLSNNPDEFLPLEINGQHKFKNSVSRTAYPLAGDLDLDGN